MRELGTAGVVRGRKPRTTIADPKAARSKDLVDRHFAAMAPDRLWVADFTYVPTWSGMVYVAFVFDVYSRRILGWRAATSMRTDLVLDCLEMAMWTRRTEGVVDLSGLVHHTDAGSQYRPSRSLTGLSSTASTPQSGRSATPTKTLWQSRRSGCTRPSSSTPAGPGPVATRSRPPLSSGCIGSTPNGPTARSTI